MNLFGKKKQAPPKLSETIQKLREALDVLDKRERHLQKQLAAAVQEAIAKSRAKDKRGALFQIKRKRMFEKQIDQIYGKKQNIEMQIMALESAAGNQELLDVMRLGNHALRQAIQTTDVDQVEEVMEDINEQIALGDEIGDVMSQSIGPVMDEDELAKELEEMESQMLEEELLKTPTVPAVASRAEQKEVVVDTSAFANVPARQPVVATADSNAHARETPDSKESQEARELRQLEALMGM